MNVFDLRDRLVGDYASYTRSFIKIADTRIAHTVECALTAGEFWPEPLLQLNPTFLPGGTIDRLVADGTLHPECATIFRINKSSTDHTGKELLLHTHQREAILKAKEGQSYVLTSGTGSGKSLTYIVPIVDHVLRHGSGRGIQAIVVYPMNALANSQDEELGKFLGKGERGQRPSVRFARYTGQEKGAEKEAIRAAPPDILLTNYLMLEFLLTRSEDRELVRAAQGVRFLVLGFARDTCNFRSQRCLSGKVSFLGQPIGMTFGLENQQIVRVVLPNPFRTRDQLTTNCRLQLASQSAVTTYCFESGYDL